MRFDLIISNPSYNNSLDLKILKAVYRLGNRICFVHPMTWLFDKKHIFKLYNSVRELVKNHFSHYEIVENSNDLFGIYHFVDCGITYFDKDCNTPIDIDEIDIHGNSEIYKSIKHKILTYCKEQNNMSRMDKPYNKKDWETGISGVRGHPGLSDFHTFIQNTDESMHVGKTTVYRHKFGFDTEVEAINFKDYLKTKVARFCLSIYKINQNLDCGELGSVPYFNSYKNHYTDDTAATEIGLSIDELAYIKKWIPNYHKEDENN